MEALPTEWIYSFLMHAEGNPLSPSFEDLGFEHHLVLNNFGTLGIIFALTPLMYLMIFVISLCNACSCCRRTSKYFARRLYWGFLLRLVIEGYVICLICSLINLVQLDLSRDSDYWTFTNSTITLVVIPCLLIFPLGSMCFMWRNLVSLKTSSMQQKYGEMTLGYKIANNAAIFYWLLEYIRKIILGVVVVLTRTHFWLQLISLFMISIFIIIAAGYSDARDSRFNRNMDIFNEIKVMCIMYHLMLFTHFLPDPIVQNNLGLSCSIVLVLGTGINMVMLVSDPMKNLKHKFRLHYAMKKSKKARTLKKHALGAKTFNYRRLQRYVERCKIQEQLELE